ncbi:MAG: serine/threonine-protein kinase [Cyanobacteria bacterium J06598_3]
MSTGGGLGASASSAGGAGPQKGPLGDRYTVVEELGRGGFGQTYLAKDLHRYDELCVVKEFVPQVENKAMLAKAKELFEREASVLYQLGHKQIPEFRQLLEVESETGGRLFIVQDYVAGPTYQALLEDRKRFGGKFSETEVTQLLYQVLPVLSYIHGMGLIHRDISPENLILRQTDGFPVLIDFGSVKEIAAAVRSQLSIEGVSPSPTRIGKVGYVPQEQLSTGNATPASDLYGLAATLLVLTTGESPQTLSDPYHGTWNGFEALSPKLGNILKRMLAATPEERFQTAEAVLAALKGAEAGGSAASSTNPAGMNPAGMTPGSDGATVNVQAVSPTEGRGEPNFRDSVYPTVGGVVGGAAIGGAAMGGAIAGNLGGGTPGNGSESFSGDPAGNFDYEVAPPMVMADADMGTPDMDTVLIPGGIDSAADQSEVYQTNFGSKASRAIGKPDPKQALLGLLVMLGLVGTLLLFALTRLMNRPAAVADADLSGDGQTAEVIPDGAFSSEENVRKQEIRTRRDGLGISGEYFTRLVDQLFYQEYPNLLTSGPDNTRKLLSDAPADEPLRIRWDHIAMTVLQQLEGNFNPQSVRALGSYSSDNDSRWQAQINAVNVGTRSLYDLVDAKFFSLFANQSGRDFLRQPMGQLYYAIADDTARAIESGSVREEISFAPGTYSQDASGKLNPGAGRIYTMALSAGQLLRLNLTAPAESTQLSLYLPEPTDDTPAVFADSEQTTWSGSVNQTGVYELVVINRSSQSVDYQLRVSVDNVTNTPPVAPPKVEETAGEETSEEETAQEADTSADTADGADADAPEGTKDSTAETTEADN